MKSPNLYFLRGIIWVLLLISASSSFGRIKIEEAQRAAAERILVTQTPIYFTSWPPRKSDGRSPGLFPEDGFYDEDLKSSANAASLVSYLAQTLSYINSVYIQNDLDFNGLSSKDDIKYILLPELPEGITPANYIEAFSDIQKFICSLKRFAIDSTVETLPSRLLTWSAGNALCGIEEVNSMQFTPNYYVNENVYLDCTEGSYDSGFYMSHNEFREYGSQYDPPDSPGGTSTCVRYSAGPAKIRFDLSKIKKGTSDVYIWQGDSYQTSDDFYPLPHSYGLNRYGCIGSLPVGSTNAVIKVPNTDIKFQAPIGDLTKPYSHLYALAYYACFSVITPDFEYNIDTCHSECESCTQNSCPIGSGDFNPQSLLNNNHANLKIGLGKDSSGKISINLHLAITAPSVNNFTPNSIILNSGGTADRIYDTNGVVRQFKTYQAMADFIVTDSSKYQVNIYPASQVSATTNASGIFTYTGNPSASWLIESVNGTNDFNGMRISETIGSKTKINQLNWTVFSNQTTQLSYSLGNNSKQETHALEIDPATSNRIESITVKNSDSSICSIEKRTYRDFPWGRKQIKASTQANGAELDTTWEYYEDPDNDGVNYGQLKQVVYPNGYWERYEYEGKDIVSKKICQFSNCPVGTPENRCRTIVTIRSAQDPAITTIESIAGKEVSRSYTVFKSDETWAIRASGAGVAWNDPSNLVTITRTSINAPFIGELQSVKHPDGTMNIYSYSLSGNQKITTTKVGKPNDEESDIVDGTKTITTTFLDGGFVSEIVYDISSGLLISSANATEYDSSNRATRIEYNDGTFKTISYGCCGVETETDREGVSTSYIYDDLKRMTISTRAGMSTVYSYDAEGNILETKRIGTDSSSITLVKNSYDNQGKLISVQDPLGNVTSYAESVEPGGFTKKTTTFSNGSNEITSLTGDGLVVNKRGNAVHPVNYEYGIDGTGQYVKEIRIGADGGESEWTLTYSDFLGRPFKKVYSDGAFEQSYYNVKGQLEKQVDADGVTTLFHYNGRGEQDQVVVDMNQNGVIENGIDRVTQSQAIVTTAHGKTVRQTTRSQYSGESNSFITFAVDEVSADGLDSWSASNGLTTSVHTSYNGTGGRTVVQTSPDGTTTTQSYQNGLLMSAVVQNTTEGTLSSITYAYDPHGRQKSATDLRNGTTSYEYDNADNLVSTTTPAPAQTTTLIYQFGRRTKTILPDGGVVNYDFYPTGELKSQSGARTYTSQYTYDSQGRIKTLLAGQGTTTWNYSQDRGFMVSKVYADGKGPSYTYYPSGRVKTRKWARGITTTYAYNQAGELQMVDYSDTTPDLTYNYDTRGNLQSVVSPVETVNYGYNTAQQMVSESHIGGPIGGLIVTNAYDGLLRRSLVGVSKAGSMVTSASYGYDGASRLKTVSSGINSVGYTYWPNSSLVNTMTFINNGTTRLTTAKDFDNLNRLKTITSTPSADSAKSFAYQYNSANQRTRVNLADGSYWVYQYDNLGQVTSGKKYFLDGSPVMGQQFDYTFDNIGNRTASYASGRKSSYTSNNLNQIGQKTVPGSVDVYGSADPNATVTVNDQPAQRKSDYFYKELQYNNTTGPVYQKVDVIGVKNNYGINGEDALADEGGNVFIPQTPVVNQYDDDGNLTQDGRWSYTWDGENRLISMQTTASILNNGSIPNSSKKKLDFVYDYKNRRIQKKVNISNGAGFGLISTVNCVWDGWRLTAEFDSSINMLKSYSYTSEYEPFLFTDKNSGSSSFYIIDGALNVTGLVESSSGKLQGEYAYEPFGKLIQLNGLLGVSNPLRWSCHVMDDESQEVYARNRYYDPSSGRWLSRDILEEGHGSPNLYNYCSNDPLDAIDNLGLYGRDVHGYFTYFAALAAGAEPNKARMIGYFAWGPDATKRLNAIGVLRYNPWRAADIQTGIHALTGGDANDFRKELLEEYQRQRIINPMYNDETFGFFTHTFQDSYAHTEISNYLTAKDAEIAGIKIPYETGTNLYPPGYGHLLNWHDPDTVSKRKYLFKEMARAYYGIINGYVPGKHMELEEFTKYTNAIADVSDISREAFIKYIVRCDSKRNIFYDALLDRYNISRLSLDDQSNTYNLPSDERFEYQSELEEAVVSILRK